MESAPDLDTGLSPGTRLRRRFQHRQRISSLVYVTLDHGNGGVVRDLGCRGVGIQAVAPLHADQLVHLRLDLARPKMRVEADGRVAWADTRGQAGITFLNLEERSVGSIKQWIFTQLLNRAQQISETGTEFTLSAQQERALGLLFSERPRPAIRLTNPPDSFALAEYSEPAPVTLVLPWLPFRVSPGALSKFVNGTILLAAVMLFSVVAVFMTETVPAWPVSAAVLLLAASLFGVAYWGLFTLWIGETLGTRLARMARKSADEEEDVPRFR
jgi:PilZ domain